MTELGRKNPLVRIAGAVRGWLFPRRVLRKAPAGKRPVLVIGHRGDCNQSCENTLESFGVALDRGADAIEVDVCVTRDDVWVLWHDADPDEKVAAARQLGAEGYRYRPEVPSVGSDLRRPVAELTLEELRAQYRYVLTEPEKGGAGGRVSLALLDDLLSWVSTETRLKAVYLDVKLTPDLAARGPDLLRILREKTDGRVRYLLLSPQREVVEAVLLDARREPLPDWIQISADFELPGVLKDAGELGASWVSMGCKRRSWAAILYELADVLAARDAGTVAGVTLWTCNPKKQLTKLVEVGVDGVITDEIALLREIVSAREGVR